MSNIVVFGGSFNPITKAHINILNKAMNYIDAKVGIIVPVGNYYSKDDLLDYNHRYNMINLVIQSNSSIIINDYNNRTIQPKTLDTLDYIQTLYPNDNIYFLMGKDNLLDFNNWYKPEVLLNKYRFIIVDRDTNNSIDNILKDKLFVSNIDHISILDTNNYDYYISSTLIRNDINKYKDYLDNSVYEYIKSNCLYK